VLQLLHVTNLLLFPAKWFALKCLISLPFLSFFAKSVDVGWGRIVAAGKFRPSTNVPNRAIVSFDTFKIEFEKLPFSLDLGFLFPLSAKIRGSTDNGWLETTFIDEDIRIGRGNKGTMFVLTRDPNVVQP